MPRYQRAPSISIRLLKHSRFGMLSLDLCFQQLNQVVDESSRTIEEVNGNLDGESGEEWNFSCFLLTVCHTPLPRLSQMCVSFL